MGINNVCFSLRNVSSNGDYGRKKLRECDGLVDALIYLVRYWVDRSGIVSTGQVLGRPVRYWVDRESN